MNLGNECYQEDNRRLKVGDERQIMGTNNVALPYSNPLGFGGAERRGPRRYGDDVKIKAQRSLTWREVQQKEMLPIFGVYKKEPQRA